MNTKECKKNPDICNCDRVFHMMKYEIDTNYNILMSMLKKHIDNSSHITESERNDWDNKVDRDELIALEDRMNEKVDTITGDYLREILQEISGDTIREIVQEISSSIISDNLSSTVENTVRQILPGMISNALQNYNPSITVSYQDLIQQDAPGRKEIGKLTINNEVVRLYQQDNSSTSAGSSLPTVSNKTLIFA